jgi:nitronate monooxygenase
MTIKTPLCSLLDIVHPVLLAPMGSIAGGSLAAAVSGAGGLGLIGGGYGDRDWLERQFEAAGNGRVGVGFITWSLARNPVLLDIVLERKPAAIFLSFGDPRPYVEKVKASGAKLLIQVQTMAEATDAKNLGADVIIAQGTEAGGHGKADRAIFPLVPAVVDAVGPTPVLAAGGVSDGRQLAAALLLGAAGVLVGTRFYASHEALGHPEAKARIVKRGGDETLRTHVFDIVRALDWPKIYTGRALTK